LVVLAHAYSLGSVTFTSVSSTGALEVRIYGFNASGSQGTYRIAQTLTLAGSLN